MTPAHVPPPTGHAPNVALVAPNTPQVLAQAPFTNNGPLLQPSQPSTTNGADPTPTEAVVTTYECTFSLAVFSEYADASLNSRPDAMERSKRVSHRRRHAWPY